MKRLRLVVALLLASHAVAARSASAPADSASMRADARELQAAKASLAIPPTGDKALRGPVSENDYVVGPGDDLSITVAGGSVDTYRIRVTPEGDVILPGVAAIRVSGMQLVDAKQQIRDTLARHFRNVDVRISLVGLRRIEVHVVGNVVSPGTYVGTALDPTSAMIEAAGGLGEDASRRNIHVTRLNGEERRIDLVRYERLGDLQMNPPILDGDVVRVPYAKTRVYVHGAVESPGTFEFVEGDSVGGLLDIAGGLVRDARDDSLEVTRLLDDVQTQALILPLPEGRSHPLQDGDQINVRFLTDHRPMTFVTLEGEFLHPGPYGINEGKDRLAEVIQRAGGFTDHASLEEGHLVRTTGVDKTDLEYERLKTIPVQDMSETEYAYFKSKARERKGLVVVNFVRLADGDESEDRLLQNGDKVIVPTRRATVTVSGSVKFPGLITHVPGRKGSYYIREAGGYASRADKDDARVIKSVTGEWEPAGRAKAIEPGDEIWVPEEGERDWWVFAQDAVRFAASIATVYLVIQQATD